MPDNLNGRNIFNPRPHLGKVCALKTVDWVFAEVIDSAILSFLTRILYTK